MELKVTTLEGKEAGSVELSDAIFGLEPRQDIVQRCVIWQLAKRQAGTHKAKGRAEIWRTGKKMYKQKGTGGARHGSQRVPAVPRRRSCLRSGGALARHRPAEEGPRAGAEACSVGQGQGRRADRDRQGRAGSREDQGSGRARSRASA